MVSPVPEPTSLSPLLGTLLPQGPRCFAWGGPHCAHLCIPLGTDSMPCPAHEEGFTLSIYLLSVLPATYLRYLLTCTPQAGRAQRTRWETPPGHSASKPSTGKPPGLHTAYLDPHEHGLGVSTNQTPQGQRTTDNCARSCLQEHPLPPMSPGRGVLLGVQTQGQPPQYV